jgi:hypothetical protein
MSLMLTTMHGSQSNCCCMRLYHCNEKANTRNWMPCVWWK